MGVDPRLTGQRGELDLRMRAGAVIVIEQRAGRLCFGRGVSAAGFHAKRKPVAGAGRRARCREGQIPRPPLGGEGVGLAALTTSQQLATGHLVPGTCTRNRYMEELPARRSRDRGSARLTPVSPCAVRPARRAPDRDFPPPP